MRLICSVSVSSRLLASFAMKAKKKSLRSTVALCKHPKLDKYCMILFTGQDKNGVKYDLEGNIEKVLIKFLSEGKATIQLKNPPHDVFIQAEVIQLRAFLHLLQRILKGTISPKELTCSSLGVTPVSSKNIATTSLVIENRSEYPIKGFPRTLERLTISKIRRSGLDLGILNLTKLRILNLSENNISNFPEEFSQMLSLQELDISSNDFHKSSKASWKWIGGNLCKTLKALNLSKNQLVYLPVQIIKLRNLNCLNLNENKLVKLPNGIGQLANLKVFTFSNNLLEELPGSIRKLNLDIVDASHNKFADNSSSTCSVNTNIVLPICTLKEIAAQHVLDLKLPYDPSIIPATLVDYLDYEAKYCICGKSCFNVYLHQNSTLSLSTFANTIISTISEVAYKPVKYFFCSNQCMKMCNRVRAPLVR